MTARRPISTGPRGGRHAHVWPAFLFALLVWLAAVPPANAQSSVPPVRPQPPAVQVPRPPAALLTPPTRDQQVLAPASAPTGGSAQQAESPGGSGTQSPEATARRAAAPRRWRAANRAEALAPPAGAPDADELIKTEIIPVFDRFASSALRLQNAVIRHCAVPSSISEERLREKFVATVKDSAAILPLAFGSTEGQNAPAFLLTNVASSVFSTSQLNAMMAGREPTPRTLAALRNLDQARPLMGMPALERLLIVKDHTREETLANRCRLALTIAANIEDMTRVLRNQWRARNVALHWRGDTVELADRLRLRDLIQGAINTVDRLNREARQYARQPENNPALPFASPEIGRIYLVAVVGELTRHMQRLHKFVPQDDGAIALLEEIERAFEVGIARLQRRQRGAEGGFMIAFTQANTDIIDRLPAVFQFDATAFNRVVTSFEPPR